MNIIMIVGVLEAVLAMKSKSVPISKLKQKMKESCANLGESHHPPISYIKGDCIKFKAYEKSQQRNDCRYNEIKLSVVLSAGYVSCWYEGSTDDNVFVCRNTTESGFQNHITDWQIKKSTISVITGQLPKMLDVVRVPIVNQWEHSAFLKIEQSGKTLEFRIEPRYAALILQKTKGKWKTKVQNIDNHIRQLRQRSAKEFDKFLDRRERPKRALKDQKIRNGRGKVIYLDPKPNLKFNAQYNKNGKSPPVWKDVILETYTAGWTLWVKLDGKSELELRFSESTMKMSSSRSPLRVMEITNGGHTFHFLMKEDAARFETETRGRWARSRRRLMQRLVRSEMSFQ